MGSIYLSTIFLLSVVLYFISKKKMKGRIFFSYLTIIVLVIYLLWRAIFTIPRDNFISLGFGTLLYLAEFLGLVVYAFFVYLFTSKETMKNKVSINEGDNFQPSVDIFVCTYNEDVKLVAATALAAKNLKYPNKKVYICDDGNREELQDIAKRFDINYIRRDTNEHAKAGNINHALSCTQSDLILILDADFIVKKNIIFEAVPYFNDPNVALIQYPQTFYNKDPFQLLRKNLYNEQDLFMRFLEPALSKKNALIHVGTNAIIRRTSLEKIGGIPTDSITEDMATGMLLQNAGFKTLFLNKVYALGITPYSAKELIKQRKRWAQGTMQIFKKIKPRKLKGLTFIQKLCYYNAYLYWFTSFQKIIFLLAPTLFLVFNIFIVKSDSWHILLFFIPPLFMINLAFRLFIPKVRTFTSSHIYDCFVAPYHASAIIAELFNHQKMFNVTTKDLDENKGYDYKSVLPHILLSLWIIMSICFGVYKLSVGSPYVWGVIVTMLWSIYNLYGLVYAVLLGKGREIENDSEALSITTNETFIYKGIKFSIRYMSYNGFRIEKGVAKYFEIGENYDFEDEESGLKISTICTGIRDKSIVFSFNQLEKETAMRLAEFYSEKLHEIKRVEI